MLGTIFSNKINSNEGDNESESSDDTLSSAGSDYNRQISTFFGSKNFDFDELKFEQLTEQLGLKEDLDVEEKNLMNQVHNSVLDYKQNLNTVNQAKEKFNKTVKNYNDIIHR